ncbi:MAG: glycosyltransferase family 2 protein [Myxococcota bacterium]|nr:glycosyltransferase family 2 protein [Myxococcota bacterium]
MSLDLSIVIMAYNEEENLPVQLERTVRFLKGSCDDWQVVVVDDGSSDDTAAVAREWSERHPGNVDLVQHPENRGMGAAIRSGYAAARCTWFTQLPADCQVNPTVFERFLPHLDTCDIVLSVYRDRGDSVGRRMLSQAFYLFVRLVVGARGDFTGTMVFRRSLLEDVPTLHSDSFFLNLEFPIQALRMGVPHTVVEIEAQPRLHGQSKVANLKRIRMVAREAIAMRLRGRD